MEQCIALADYDAMEPDEITFRRGDVIAVTAKGSTSGFWEGFVVSSSSSASSYLAAAAHAGGENAIMMGGKGRRGLFPNCFVSSNMRPQQPPTFCNKALCLYDYKAEDASEMSFKAGDILQLVRPSASPGWWCGINETQADRMRQASESKRVIAQKCGTFSEPLLLPSNFVTCRIVMTAFSFEARQKHELMCNIGDVIHVHRKWNDGWWEGTLRGRRGIFPSNYTLPNVATTNPPFFCNICKTVFTDSISHCENCSKENEVTRSMITALNNYAAGKMTKLDLFAYVDIDTSSVNGKEVNISSEGFVRHAARLKS